MMVVGCADNRSIGRVCLSPAASTAWQVAHVSCQQAISRPSKPSRITHSTREVPKRLR